MTTPKTTCETCKTNSKSCGRAGNPSDTCRGLGEERRAGRTGESGVAFPGLRARLLRKEAVPRQVHVPKTIPTRLLPTKGTRTPEAPPAAELGGREGLRGLLCPPSLRSATASGLITVLTLTWNSTPSQRDVTPGAPGLLLRHWRTQRQLHAHGVKWSLKGF